LLIVAAAVFIAAASTAVGQQAAASEPEFLRISYDDAGEPLALQSVIARYRLDNSSDSTINVDLVGALHIADRGYFADLNKRFKKYDSVLYELIAESGTRVPAGGPDNPGALSSTQGAITNVLGLSFQLEEIDYQATNFVHADMSPEQVAESMTERNESLYQYFWKIFFFATREYAKDPLRTRDIDLLAAFFAPDQQRALKIELAKELVNVDDVTQTLEGPDGSTLISGRNQKAFDVLAKRIDAGDRRIAVFFGAGHLSDMHRRLVDDFGFQPLAESWLDAWALGNQ